MRRFPLAATVLLGLGPWGGSLPARAQMDLPGAVAPTPEGTAVPADAATPKTRSKARAAGASEEGRKPAPLAVPAPLKLAGLTLALNGRKSQITFAEHDKTLGVARLVLTGSKIADSRQDCQVSADAGSIGVSDLGRPNGLARIKLDYPACPIVFDVLDGAALAVGDPPACDFPAESCRVAPAGLWGATPGAIGPAEVKAIEHERARAEADVRADFKGLLSTTRDRPTISAYAREQAGFSSAREEICRDYAGEGRHGLCATRLTQARAAALHAKFEVEAAAKAERKRKHMAR